FLPKIPHFVETDAVDHLVHEALARDVGHDGAGIETEDAVADRMQEVSLTESGAPVDEQGIVGLTGIFRRTEAGGDGKLVTVPFDEGLERVGADQVSFARKGAGKRLAATC